MQKSTEMVQVWLIILVTLILATLSCNMSNLARLGREEAPQVPVSTQAAGQLVTNIEDALATASAGGVVTLVLTEQQLTSLVALEMQKSGSNEIQDLQIHLRDGLVKITGRVNQSGLTLNAAINVKINIDARGRPYSEVVSARVGPFPIPQNMLDEITAQLDSYLLDQISQDGKQLVAKQITIADGTMTVVGTLQ